jgi:death-on-curing protein
VIYLTYADLLHIAERATNAQVLVRDAGLLEGAAIRPQMSVFGDDAYPRLEDKAAALIHSIARNHALVDGNKRLALAAAIAFLGINGRRLIATNNEAYDFIIAIATGLLDEVESIAGWLEAHSGPR